ncbi:MAG: hypothetical protein OCD76_23400 [Reichenbachiella sp.]
MKETTNSNSPQIWLFSKGQDLLLLGLPIWLCWLICFALPPSLLEQEIPLWAWVIVVLGIDVGHVWSTLFRTYLDRDEIHYHKRILKTAPVIGFALCFLVAYFSTEWFWTLLAYLALYHFIKQQYGFMKLYQAKYGRLLVKKLVSDEFAIYWSMLGPVVFWHLSDDRAFSWFMAGDFFSIDMVAWPSETVTIFYQIGFVIYFGLITFWLAEEIWIHIKNKKTFPLGKWLWVLTTVFNWFLGIAYFNSDLAFTLTNVVAHGIPYFVLLLVYVQRKNKISPGNKLSRSGMKYGVLVVITVLLLAFFEEYLWDMFLYGDNYAFFESIIHYPFELLQSPLSQALALALLSLPQVTHYILDGYIWKANKNNPYLKPSLLH